MREGEKEIRSKLVEALKAENAFWSYQSSSINMDSISDDILIAYTLRYLDLPEIEMLYNIFSSKKIKNAWKEHLVPEGEYLYALNRFIAWYYFGAKSPDAYLKSLQTRHLNRLLSHERSQ